MVKLLLALLSLAWAEIYVSGPDSLRAQFSTQYNSLEIPSCLSDFGSPPYGSFLVGYLYQPIFQPEDCGPFAAIDFSLAHSDPAGVPVLLLLRGQCKLAHLVRKAEDIGAAAVIFANYQDEELSDLSLRKSSESAYVSIPSFLINKSPAQLLQRALYSQVVTLNLTFSLHPVPREVVYSFVISSGGTASRGFLLSLASVLEPFQAVTSWVPHYLHDGCILCNSKDCLDDYCAPFPSNLPLGRDIVAEDLRQICIYREQREKWWNYTLSLIRNCPVQRLGTQCYLQAFAEAGVNANLVNMCVSDSFHMSGTLFSYNSLLDSEKNAVNSLSATLIPAFFINKVKVKGNLEPQQLFKALCASFLTPPAACAPKLKDENGKQTLQDGVPVNIMKKNDSAHIFGFEFTINNNSSQSDLKVEATFYSNPAEMTLNLLVEGKVVYVCSQVCVLNPPASEVKTGVVYSVEMVCTGPCHFSLVMSYINTVKLRYGEPLKGGLKAGQTRTYDIATTDVPPTELTISLLPDSRDSPAISVRELKSNDSFLVEDSWHRGLTCRISPVMPNTVYRAILSAVGPGQYLITAVSRNGVQTLQTGVPTQGTVEEGQFAYYKLLVDNPQETLVLQLTTFEGAAEIYVKYGLRPTELVKDFSLSKHSASGTLTIDKHQRNSLGYPTGEYYIGVFGNSQAAFTLLVSVNTNSWVPLFDGLPQNGYADFDEVDYYYMDLPVNQDLNVTFRVNVLNGNPDIYVRMCGISNQTLCEFTESELTTPEPHPDIYYSRKSGGDESVSIVHAAQQCIPARCRYIIAIRGRTMTRSRFALIGTLDKASEHVLMSGLPMEMTLYQADYIYFKYSVFNASVSNVTIVVTPTYGDPDLYVTRESSPPSRENYEQKSTNSQTFIEKVDFVRGKDGLTLRGTYHIAVYASAPASFSIVAIERVPGRNATLQLYPGKSQQDTVYNERMLNYRVYLFSVHYMENSGEELTLALTPLSGRYEMYVANNPNAVDWDGSVFYYDWCYCGVQPTDKPIRLTIAPDHPAFRKESDYLVLVKALAYGHDSTASYTLTYTTESSIVTLQESIPYQDIVLQDIYKNYAFPILAVHEDIRIEVLPSTGDPDVYISFTNSNQRPTKELHDYYMHSHGPEIATLQWEQGIGAQCPLDEKDLLQNCMLYIGVYGYTTSVYTISVSVRRHQPMLLPLGMQGAGELILEDWRYYSSLIHSNLPLSVHLQSRSGNANLYLNVLDYVVSSSDTTALLRPTKKAHHYSSVSTWMFETIDLKSSMLTETCVSGTCIALMGVVCDSLNCSFSLTATQEATHMLIDDEPKIGAVEAFQFIYYVFYNTQNATSIVITVTPLDSGDPALFVSRSDTAKPTRSRNDWESMHPGREQLVISADDAKFQRDRSMIGYYSIGVWAGTNCTFSIGVSTHILPIVTIMPRVPIESRVSAYNVSYYKYQNTEIGDLEFRITPLEGSAEVRISPYLEANGDIYDYLPTSEVFFWSSLVSGIRNTIRIPQADRQIYLIGVFPGSTACHYSLGVYTSLAKTLLLNGIPTEGHVREGAWVYYDFIVNSLSDIDLALTLYSGDSEMYATAEEFVSADSYTWRSAGLNKSKHIRIPKSSLPQGILLIGIYGSSSASFAVTAHSRDTAIALVDGWPHVYSVLLDPKDHLFFRYPVVTDAIVAIECRLKSLAMDFWPLVNVKFLNGAQSSPSSDATGQNYNESDYEHLFQTLTLSLPFQGLGAYFLTVYGELIEGSAKEETRAFELTCAGQTDFERLRTGGVAVGTVTAGKRKKRYELFVAESSTLKTVVVACMGKVDLSISSNYTKELGESDISVAKRTVDNKVISTVAHAKGQYYLTVEYIRGEGITTNATFELSAQVVPTGTPQSSSITAGNDGLLSWSVRHHGQVNLTWAPAVYESGQEVSLFIAYVLFASESASVKLTSTCSIRTAVLTGLAWEITKGPITAHSCLISTKEGVWTQVNVIALIPSERTPLLNSASYLPAEILVKQPAKGSFLPFVAALLVFLLLVLLGLGVYHFKYRRTKRRLEHEVTVVRGVSDSSSSDIELPQAYSSVSVT